MSISNYEAGGAPFDPAVIARLANELFAALPGRPAPPPGAGMASAPPATPPVEVGALPVAPAIPPSSAAGPLTEVEFRSLPATMSGATLRPPQAGLSPSAVLGPYDFRPELIPDEGFLTLPGGGIAPGAAGHAPGRDGRVVRCSGGGSGIGSRTADRGRTPRAPRHASGRDGAAATGRAPPIRASVARLVPLLSRRGSATATRRARFAARGLRLPPRHAPRPGDHGRPV